MGRRHHILSPKSRERHIHSKAKKTVHQTTNRRILLFSVTDRQTDRQTETATHRKTDFAERDSQPERRPKSHPNTEREREISHIEK